MIMLEYGMLDPESYESMRAGESTYDEHEMDGDFCQCSLHRSRSSVTSASWLPASLLALTLKSGTVPNERAR